MIPVPAILAAAVAGLGLAVAGVALRKPAQVTAPDPKALPEHQRQWLQDLVFDASPVLAAGRMPLSVAFGQAAIETGWGKSLRDNPWGKRGVGDAGSQFIATHESFEAGTSTLLHDQKFAAFSSQTAAALGYVKFLNSKLYAPGHLFRSRDAGRWLLWLWAAGYATSGSYAQAVRGASKTVAKALGNPDLEVPWSPWHGQVADELGAVDAGSARRGLARKRLGLGDLT